MTPWITKPVPFNIGQGAAAAAPGFIEATGGTITIDPPGGDYKVHTFTSTGDDFEITAGLGDVQYLVIGGGGGSMDNWGHSGGAGAGGYKTNTVERGVGTYTVTVGAGGAGGGAGGDPGQGGDSVFDDVTSDGGGYGGNWNAGSTHEGGNGGCGGGGQSGGSLYAGGTGNAGGDGKAGFAQQAGGGGGASENAPNKNGGDGLTSDILVSGSDVTRAGGGGGSGEASGTSTGGAGGGGNGGDPSTSSTAPTPNTGSGAGGAGNNPGNVATGAGGIVILRYQFQ